MSSDTLPILLPSPSETWRAARNELARRANVQEVPRVVWSGLTEPADAFAARIAVIRRTWSGRILAAVPYGFDVPSSVEPVFFTVKMFSLLHPSVYSRYRVASGGRGSGKSHAIATAWVLDMLVRGRRKLAVREIMKSLRESVHHLLVAKIDALKLAPLFEITDTSIVCAPTGSEIIFAGLAANVQQLKSLEGVGDVWCEEAESVSQRSIEILTPTIRAEKSEIWFSCNPDSPDAPIMGFINGSRPDTRHMHVIFSDNPWFPKELEGERAYLQRVDDDAYQHVWLGRCRTHSDAQVFRGKFRVEDFGEISSRPGISGPYYGVDWGFANDPTTLIRCWVYRHVLFVDFEAYSIGCDTNRVPQLFDTVPGARGNIIRADCSRPETISALQQAGYTRIVACAKWTGCAEDGVAHIRSYERVFIHPRCAHTADEFRLCSYKVDKLSGNVLADLKSGNDHLIDALRYALEPLIARNGVTSQATWAALASDEPTEPVPPATAAELEHPAALLNSSTSQWASLSDEKAAAPAAPVETREEALERRRREGRERVEQENERQREAARVRRERAGEL
jgi:phage terminase large subunit